MGWRYVRSWVHSAGLRAACSKPGLFCCRCGAYRHHGRRYGRIGKRCALCGTRYQSTEWWDLAAMKYPAIAKAR